MTPASVSCLFGSCGGATSAHIWVGSGRSYDAAIATHLAFRPLVCWKHMTHEHERKKKSPHAALGALAARQPPVILLKQDASSVVITPASFPSRHQSLGFVLPLHPPPFPPSIPTPHPDSLLCIFPCLFSLPRGSLRLFRRDLSSSVELQSAHHSAGCLERLTMTNQTPQTFHRSPHSTNLQQ